MIWLAIFHGPLSRRKPTRDNSKFYLALLAGPGGSCYNDRPF